MKSILRIVIATILAITTFSAVNAQTAPPVMADMVVVYKSARTMQLFNNNVMLRSYSVDLGFAPDGDKLREGDGRTPEGTYIINRRNPNSSYHLSLGISYPNVDDFAAARAQGYHPGGDIFIHGGPILPRDRNKPDWTAGCISVTNREIEEIWTLVADGTFIVIVP